MQPTFMEPPRTPAAEQYHKRANAYYIQEMRLQMLRQKRLVDMHEQQAPIPATAAVPQPAQTLAAVVAYDLPTHLPPLANSLRHPLYIPPDTSTSTPARLMTSDRLSNEALQGPQGVSVDNPLEVYGTLAIMA